MNFFDIQRGILHGFMGPPSGKLFFVNGAIMP
jgi:hypothetical protein